MSTLELRRLRKVFLDGTVAVDDVDLAIADGEFVAIVGPSGCGKTTVLRMVAGLEAPTDGEMYIDGELVNDQTAQQRDIAMAFQQHALYPHMTVEENLGFPLRMAGLHHRDVSRRVTAMAEVLGLGNVLSQMPHRLSGGQQQRVSMGRAIIRNPRLFLMDEPMSNLDAKMRTAARTEITRIQRRLRATTLLVTHDQVEAMAMADRVVVMRQGRIVQMGTPLEVYRHPVDVFVAQFIGTPPMSVVPARIVSVKTEPPLGAAGLAGDIDQDTDADENGDADHVVVIGPFRVALPSRTVHAEWVGRRIVLGLRPAAFRRAADGPILASVDHIEQLGAEQLVHATIDCPGIAVVADERVNATKMRVSIRLTVDAHEGVSLWEPLRLDLDLGETHVFDLASGRRLGVLSGDEPLQTRPAVSSALPRATPEGASAGR